MGEKYEVTYFDYESGTERSVLFTKSFLKAWWKVLKLNKKWPCVGIRKRNFKI